mgnify:CR=1 FL=1
MSVRDPWFDAMEVVLGAMEAASKRGSRRGVSDAHASPGLTNPTRRKHRTPVGVKWIASTIGRAVVADGDAAPQQFVAFDHARERAQQFLSKILKH